MPVRSELKARARENLHGNVWTLIGAAVIEALILSAATSVTFGIGALLLTGVLSYGFYSLFLDVARGERAEFEGMFRGFYRFGNTCGAGILISVFTTLWSLLFFIPGIVKAISYSMTYFIMRDHPEYGAYEAIQASQRLTQGHKAEIFVLYLSFIGWWLLSGITCGIVGFYVAPYMNTTLAIYYDELSRAQGEE